MSGIHVSQDTSAQDDAVAQIARSSGELKRLADRNDLAMLAYLLDMVRLEATQHLRRSERKQGGTTMHQNPGNP